MNCLRDISAKNISLLLLIILVSFQVLAQNRDHNHHCSTVSEKSEWLIKFQQNQESYEKTADILYVPISLHFVGTAEGQGYFSRQNALDELCKLNQFFEEAEIYFFLEGGIHYINNTDWFQGNQAVNMMNVNNVDNTINCYIVDGSSSDITGFYSTAGDAISISRQGFNGWSPLFAHEIGHYFSLAHTFLGWESTAWNYSNPAPVFVGGHKVERVDGLDCEIAGDGFCDTPPDYLSGFAVPYFCDFNEESFIVQTDPIGATFQSDCSLIMSYSTIAHRFSEMQISAMRANIEQVRPYLLYNQNPLPEIDNQNVVLTSPSQGAMISSDDPLTLEWESVINATNYLVDITFTLGFSAVYDQHLAGGNSIVIDNLLPGKNYRWRVRPYNPFHTCVPYSVDGEFSTGEAIECEQSVTIGTTVYDLQTNASVCNRLSRDSEGNIMATWTMGFDHETGYPDRGTGYNRFDAASETWEAIPTQRLEANTRTGWPNHTITESGTEFIVNHVFTSQGVFLHTLRRAAGSNNWVEGEIPTSTPSGVITARVVSSGDTIHIIAPSTPLNFGGMTYEGVNGHLLYYRSPNGGISWDIVDGIIPGLDDSFMTELGSIDNYAIDAREGIVVLGVFSSINDVLIFQSNDGGSNWNSTRIHDFPIDMYHVDQGYSISDLPSPLPQQPDPFAIFTSDNSGSVLVDRTGMIHAFYGQMYIKDTNTQDGGIIRFPKTSGISYWNETFGLDSTRTIADIADLNGNNTIEIDLDAFIAPYFLSMTSTPSPAVDNDNNIYLAYSSVMEGNEYQQNEESEHYRHIMIIHSKDGGATWSAPYDAINETILCDPDIPYFVETNYPAMVRDIDDEVLFLYQQDYRPGISLIGDPPETNLIRFARVPVSEFGIVETEEVLVPGSFRMALWPNPASGQVTLEFNLENNGQITLGLHDLLGRQVEHIESSYLGIGMHSFQFDVSNYPTGLYLVKLQIEDKLLMARLVVI